ncbi:MAG: DEAD/DEAH box helicase family protein [Saprospiraceae bacterium]|nr:DEAD/DEAH box helicase family protein [Saprospiraceae bacterium]
MVYADCVEQLHGRRPIIFYTNGFETWLWDDQFYPPRQVHGFYEKAELQLLIDRRSTRKDLRKYTPDPAIAGRYYQKEAIQRIAETFVADDKQGISGKRRKALVVMATGTGKTRMAVALVDILMKANWAKRVLFLADRNALVTQAKRAFGNLLTNLTAIDLTKEREDTTTRLVFSTYPTIMNRIDAARNPDGVVYGVGHFDLIIVDEAHRSIYEKYEDIFHYFDALIVGLTATPKDETHHDTYQAFECEQGNPTYYYELNQAVSDGFLVPPKKLETGTKFLRRGIKYSELSEAEQQEYEAAFARMGEEVPDEIGAAAINRWLFNKDTVIKVLDALMSHGHRVESGDKIGKTIIFANSQDHAEFIEKVFNEQYPEQRGHFVRTISYKDQKFAQDLIDKFKIADRYPQIAISVDMLDTGIDVPEIVNLVLFKPVYSKSKFWQMLGRGTRLREDLFGPGEHKQDFYVFDCCGNFEFFDMNPMGVMGNALKSISHRIFELRILLAEALREPQYQDESFQDYRNLLLDLSHGSVQALYEKRDLFRGKGRLATIEKFLQRESWEALSMTKVQELRSASARSSSSTTRTRRPNCSMPCCSRCSWRSARVTPVSSLAKTISSTGRKA